jgi:hypothetical protein
MNLRGMQISVWRNDSLKIPDVYLMGTFNIIIGGIQTSPTASNIWDLKGRKRAIHTTATASASRISSLVRTEKYPTFTDKYTSVTKGIAIHIALGIFHESGVNSCAPERLTVPAPLVTLVVLIHW